MSTGASGEKIKVQPRDLAILQELLESRILTARHLAILCFDGNGETAKKRLQKLKAAGYIGERNRRAYDPAILFLTRKAFELLDTEGILAQYPPISLPSLLKRTEVGQFTVSHELDVLDVKAAFHAALAKSGRFSLAEFTTWPLLCQFQASRGHDGTESLVKPDGFIRILEREADGTSSEMCFFLEMDRSSERLDVLSAKAARYFSYYRSGDFAVRNGGTREEFKQHPFRVLMVFKSEERRNIAAEEMLRCQPLLLTQLCLATFEEAASTPLQAIWLTLAAYRDAVKDTPFDVSRPRTSWAYQRHAPREKLVAERGVKLSLVED